MNSNPVPWWALSPSPFTLVFWGVLSLYGASRLSPKTLRQWLRRFGDSAFILGLIILPFDATWQIGQWLKFGYLYPTEITMVITVLARDIAGVILCLILSRNLFGENRPAQLKGLVYLLFPIASLASSFLMAVDPGWTDWTYVMRYGSTITWQMSFISGLDQRLLQALAYYKLWKR